MAASEEESGQSDSKNDDSATHETSKQFSTIHQQEIENQLSRPGLSYENRVSAVLSGWEHLAGTVEGDVGQLQPLATFLYRWSLRLILQGEWPGLAQIVKTRLGVTLQRCSRVAVLQPLCRTLLPLVSDPWGQTTKTIFSDSEVQDEEAIKYISNESWEVVRVRVDTMVESRCEELAFRVLKVCIRCIRLRSEGMGVPLYTDEDHNHFVDLYFVLLYKFQRKAFLEEVKALDVHEGVNLVQRLVTKQDKAKVWKHRLKIADLAIQIFLATSIVKKYSHDFWAVFLEWCGVQEAAAVADDVLIQMIHKYMQLCEASQHIYSMGSILHKKFGNRLASLVTELLIRALTMDMNSLEALKLKQTEGSQKEEQVQLERQMADGFMDLATVFTHHKSVARECVLTAFSLHPTTERLVLLSSFAGSSPSSDISHVLEQPHSFSKHSTPHPISPLPQSSFSTNQSSPTFIPAPSSLVPHSSDMSQPPSLYQPGSPPQFSSSPSIPHLSPSHAPPASHPVPSSPLTTVPTSYSISSPAPHFPSATLRPEASSDGTEMELSTTCLQSTSTSDIQTGSFNTSEGTGVVQTTQSTTCLQSSSSDFHTTPCSQDDSQIPDLSTLENSAVSDPVHNSLNYVGVQNSVNVDNMEVTSSSEVQVSQNDLQTDELNIKGLVSPVSDQRGLSCEDHCRTDIMIDTGQPYPNMSSVVDSEESQMIIENSAQNKMEDLSLSQTKDISTNDKELDSISHGESRMKDDVDSMDKFYKSTENFIEQLSQEPPSKSKLTNLSPGHQNYDVLTQPNQVLDAEQLGITKELCDDLAVVLSSPRWQVLSWVLDWGELSKICGQYIKDADSAKNMTKELKYLNIDYSQFQNMPSAEITEFTGIEKGYEHFIEHESENEVSDDESSAHPKGGHISPIVELANTDTAKITKRGRGRPKKISQISRPYDSDSDLDAVEQLKGSSCYMISMSESEESDIDNKNKTYLHIDSERSGVIEGKRVTAVSNQDRSKRIRIDAETGKLRKDRSLLNSLRLFRHQKYGGDLIYDSEFEGLQRSAENFAPPLSSLNLNPRVVLTERDKSAVDQQLQRSMTTAMAGKRVASGKATQSSQSRESWRYAGSFVAPNPTSAARPTTSVPLPRSPSVQCYVRHKDGKVRFASFNRSILAGSRPPNPGQNNYLKLLKRPTSGYDDSYAKFLLQQNPSLKGKGPEDATRKSMTLDASLDYLKKQGTTVTYRRKTGSALALANAQKTVLNRIMSPENAISAISSRTAIAMPVSNNPPNLPPSDKTSPANLSRVLPKGTTVVRKPKSDGAGPSGLSNNSGSGSSSGTRTVVSRPASFPTVVARPNTTVSSVVRSGSSIMAVRTNASTIRTTYSRSVVVTGSLGTQEAATNRSTSPPLTDSSPSTPGGVPSGSGSSSSSTPTPLVSATVVGSVLTTVPSSSPMGTQSGNTGKQQQQQQQLLQQSWDVVQNEGVCLSGVESNTTITQMSSTTRGATTCTTTVASPPGDTRAASMLETLLRDRPVPPSPLHTQSTTAITTITAALPSTITSIVGSSSVPMAVTGESQVTNAVVGALSSTGNNTGNVVIASGSNANSGVIMASGVVGAPTGGGVVVASSGIVSSSGVGVNSSVGEGGSGAVQQVLLPGQIVQVHTSDGTTGIGIVQSSSLDLRLPAGTRVIKPGGGTIRTTAAQQQQVTGVINQTGSRQVNVLHNVKILQNVQNRQIVRTVVVPHPVALQGLNTPSGQLKPQVVSLSQGTCTSVSTAGEGGVIQPQVPSTTVRAKIPPTTIVQKVLSRSGLVIRTVRPQTSSTQASGDAAPFEEGLGAKLQQQQQGTDGEKTTGATATTNVTVARLPQDEGLGERLSHYLKTALASSTSTQSVGTQTLTTAVKPSAGQLVNQVAMNHLRSGGNAALSLSGGIPGMSGPPNTISTSPTPPQQANIPSLPLTPTNAVSSETLEQIREFESVFEKVSNKSGKEGADGEASVDSYTSTPMSSEESMIAAQLLSMANDNPAVTTSSSYVYSVPTTVYDASGTRLTEGTYITIPSTTQAGTLILVNHSGSGTGLVTVASGVQNQQQPPPAASPALSSTSSHSSIASSPSSTSSKTKKPPPKSKTVPPATPPVVAKPKTPPPPKAPAPKPTVAKPQLEESDETKARIQAILEQYKQDLANTPQPQPAPRNRKNCPPPKNEGKTSTKKKSPVKKVEGGAGNSPAVSEGSIVGCPSPSPSPGPANDNSVGPSSSATGGQPVQFSSQVVSSQGSTTPGNHSVPDEKIKAEGSPEVVVSAPQILQGVMVSNVKVEGSNLSSNSTNLAQGIAGGRFVQLIRHCGKVTTITTRQPINKAKSANQGGPPPNVTIQGRISMNDLMESHIASLLTGGGSALTQTPSVVSKIVQQQQLASHQGVQQVVVQTSGGQQVLQQVAVQQLPTSPVKQQQQKPQQKSSVIQQLCIASKEELSGASSQTSQIPVSMASLPNTLPNNMVTIANTSVLSAPAVSKISTNSSPSPPTNTSGIPSPSLSTANSTSIVTTSGPIKLPSLSSIPNSPLTPQVNAVTSPPTPQPVSASPHTPSPATEPSPTPSSFQMGEESNSSEQSVGEGLAGPLPPFLTLKSFIMRSPQQPSPQTQQTQTQKIQPEQKISDKCFTSGTGIQQVANSSGAAQETATASPSVAHNKTPQRGNQSHVQLQISQPPRKPTTVIRSGGGNPGRRLIVGAVDANGRTVAPGTAGSLVSGTGEAGITTSSMSSSSHEGLQANAQSRIRLATRPQDMRSNSIDSLKSDLSVEEVQIPPSPATLTKQIQSAYMTEAALSPSVSQSQHSGSSYSSPSTTHDLPFTEPPATSDDSSGGGLTQPGHSSAPPAPGLSVTGISPEGDTQMGALTSPSGDVYLHQSGTGLGLESLEAGTLPLVSGMEVRTHSPALSDLVSSGPLLTWSPRSADSMMAQSPSLNDALTANIPLDVNHSEDSLCDSSTGFPGLFSIEGDGVSVSSSTSEDTGNNTVSVSNNQQHTLQPDLESQEQIEVTIDLHPRESEQDHTITSTRSPTQLELPVATLRGITTHNIPSSGSIIINHGSQETPWRFDNTIVSQAKSVINQPSEPTNGHHNDKQSADREETAGPSNNVQGKQNDGVQASYQKGKQKRGNNTELNEQEVEDVRIVAEVVAMKGMEKTRKQSKSDGKIDGEVKKSQEGNSRKRSQYSACPPDKRKLSVINENEVKTEEIPTKNGHEDDPAHSNIKIGNSSVGRNKRRSSQRAIAASSNAVSPTSLNRTRTKSLKSEANIKQEHGSGLLGIDIKDEKLIKLEKIIKEHSDGGIGRTRGAKKRTETDSIGEMKEEESQGEQKIGGEIKQSEDTTDMKFSEGECGEEMRRGGRGARAAKRGDGYVLMEEEVQNHLDEDSAVPRGNRGRHISGTSDTSSNYSVECAVAPAALDTPSISGGRRRRRHSRESSASSRDGSPLTIHSHEFPPSGVNTRRSSSRDHAKKKKCSCCVGGEQRKSTSGSGRRVSTRAARGSSSGSLQ
ncbi:mucin-17-like isoform X1 [Portunus trituberculatus]|uniref:mucin-17-like isoform X1 n=1 Tax=Portunus trituberculatus TaxID=210409 RepID=UPI001E1CB670|nr:mucin-17-like isoform X1 [Portunus trituberculatus]